MSITKNIHNIIDVIPNEVCLVAVSKTKSNEAILDAYKIGQKVFGENKVQELVMKSKSLPTDIQWHMIGHLQSNKVKLIAPFISLIHAVDSLKLLKTIHKEGLKNNRTIDCLLQVHIAQEESKFGLDIQNVETVLKRKEDFPNARIVGLMGMATFSDDNNLVRREFKCLNKLYQNLQNTYPQLQNLSMGMSGDYKIAISEGSNMVRIGASIFGTR